MTREEIDAIYSGGNQKITRADIDKLYNVGTQKVSKDSGISSPKIKAAPDNTAKNDKILATMDPKVREAIFDRRDAAARGSTVWEENAPLREAAMIKEKSKRGLSVVEQNDMRRAEEAVKNQRIPRLEQQSKNDVKEDQKIPVLESTGASALSSTDKYKLASPTGIIDALDNESARQFLESKQRNEMQKKVDSERNPMLKNRYQEELDELVRDQNQIVLSDSPTQEEVDTAMNQWLNTGYKMTDDEKKSAQEYITRYEATAKNPNIYSLTEAEQAELDRVNTLRDKIHGSESLAYGIMSAMPFVDIGMRKADTDGTYANALANAQTQNPVAYHGGEIASNLAQYAVGSKAMQAIPQVASVTGKAGQALGKGIESALGTVGSKMAGAGGKWFANLGTALVNGGAQKAGQAIGSSATNIMSDMVLDTSLDTVPNAVYDAQSGLSGAEVAGNAAKNIGVNLGWNVIGEGAGNLIPYLYDLTKNKISKWWSGRNVQEIEDMGKALNPLSQGMRTAEELGEESKNIVRQINDYANGNLGVNDYIDLGKTPEYMSQYGNVENPFIMKQSTIPKVAYPNGYMGGKHNLGYEPFAQLPYQLNDPVAVLKSNTQGNSAVVVTDMIDANGYPVIMPIHMDKNGHWGVTNEVASIYGKHNVDNMIKAAEENGNIIMINKERAHAVTSSVGLQLPNVKSEADPIFNYSIPNSSQNVNSIAEDTGFRSPELTADAKTLNISRAESSVDQTTTPEIRARSYTDETIQKTDMPEEIKNEFREDPRIYEVLKNSDTQAQADAILANNNFNGAYAQFNTLLSKKDPTAIPLGYSLSKQLAESGNTEQAIDIIDRMSEQLTKSGQFSQAAAITMLQNEPMSAMRYMEKQLDKMNATGRGKYKNWQDFELTEDEIKAFANIDKGDSEAIQELYGQITDRLAKSYPSTKWEKIVEASKTAMMLNPRTHIRNVAANAVMLPVRSLTDRVSALGQNAIHLFNSDFEVTQSLIGGTRAQKKIADQIFEEQILPLLKNTAKWNDVTKNAPRNRQVFNDSLVGKVGKKVSMWPLKVANMVAGGRLDNLISKVDKSMTDSVMENLRKFDYWLLGEVEDNVFVKENFSNRLASYMKAQRISSIDAVPNEAVQIAYQEALKATFKDDNAMTRMFSNVKRDTWKFGEVMLPFTKTPANIAMRGIDYSPAGIVNAIRQINKKVDGKKVYTGAQVVDTIAKSATGTAGIALGYKLAEAGLIQGALSSDADAQQFEKQQGKVAFSLNVGDNYYSFDWAQPAAIPIIIGSTIYDAMQESDKENGSVINSLWQGAMAATDAWADLSPLSSLQDIFGGSGYGNNSIAENVFGEIAEFPQRLLPTAMGATARTIDPTMRQTYSKGNMLQTQIDTIKSKIPFLSETLPESYDTWGNERKRQGSTASAAFANFVNPGTLGYDASTPIDGEIERLYDATQSNIVFPRKADWSVKDREGNKINLDNKQYSEYQKAMGQTSYDIADTLINSEFYSGLSDEDKAEYLSDIYSVAQSKAKHDLFGTPVADTLAKKVALYEEEGAEGLVKEMQIKHDITSNGLTVSEKTRQIYEDGGIPYLRTYNEIRSGADKDGNGGLKAKEELIPYLNGSGMSTTEKRYWFGMLSTAKNPY